MDTPVGDQNFEILSSALGAFEFLARADVEAAAGRWNRPGPDTELTRREAVFVHFSNKGVAAFLSGDGPNARVNLAHAMSALDGYERAADAGDLRATSSGYHFRLAARHASAFEQANVARGAVLRELMMAVVARHDALLDGGARDRNARRLMSNAVENVFGQGSVEARLCRAGTLADIAACYAERAAKLSAILRHWPARARLTPEVAVAALAIWPCESLLKDVT